MFHLQISSGEGFGLKKVKSGKMLKLLVALTYTISQILSVRCSAQCCNAKFAF